jgi:hypothetical protein
MAGTSTPIFPQTVISPVLMINDTNSTNILPFYQGGPNGSKIESIAICNTDTNAAVLNAYYQNGNVNYLIGTIAVPAKAGFDAAITPAVNALSSAAELPWVRNDSNGRSYVYIGFGTALAFGLQGGLQSGKKISIMGQGGDF